MKLKKPIFAFLAIILIAGTCIYYARAGAANPDDAYIAEVNGSPITVKEFKRELERQRPSVIDYFHRTYGAEYSNDFWKVKYNGENPETVGKERTLKELVRFKVELELAEQYGLAEGTSYDDLIREMGKENERRQAAIKAGQPVYGPIWLDEDAFINVYMSKLRNELKEKLSKNELQVSDKELKQHYERIKDPLFANEHSIRFEKVAVSYKDGNSIADQRKQAAMKLMNSVQLLMKQGKGMSEAVKALKGDYEDAAILYTIAELNNNTASSYFKSEPVLYSVFKGSLKVGESSSVMDETAQGEYILVRITKRNATGYKSYEDNRRNVWSNYMETAYADYLNKLVDGASITVNTRQFNRITLR